MKYRSLGNSGLMVSCLSLGSWVTFSKQLNQREATDMMAFAFEKGINFFDNAEAYGEGKSEEVMGNALKELKWDRSRYIVSSKVFWGGSQPIQLGHSRKRIIEGCHGALKRLGLDYLDLYYCHRRDPDTPISEVVYAMNTLISQGKILYWGTSEWSAFDILEAIHFAKANGFVPPTMEQPQYNLLEREKVEKEFLPLLSSYGLGLTTWSPLSSGILTNKYDGGIPDQSRLSLEHLNWLKDHFLGDQDKTKNILAKTKKFSELVQKDELETAPASIAWCLANPHVSSVILGASNIQQLSENLKSIDYLEYFNKEKCQEIEEIFLSRPEEVINPKDY